MDDENGVEQLQREIELERMRLAESVTGLRAAIERKRRPPRPDVRMLLALAAAGFVAAGGVGASVRLLALRPRHRSATRTALGRLRR